MPEFIVEPKSRREIRELTNILRNNLGLQDRLYFPIVEVIESLPLMLKGFNYEIVDDDEFPEAIHGDTNIQTGLIRIKESVYRGAVLGNGRDRMTLAHELGHFVTLCICGFTLKRNLSMLEKIPAYLSPEWQAKCFAGELLIPAHLTIGMCPEDISINCGVSITAAYYQYMVNLRLFPSLQCPVSTPETAF